MMSNQQEETKVEIKLTIPEQRGRNLYKQYGPICNSEGFYQHRGECWSDAFQMLMLYTDGIKEFTQEKLATQDVEFKEIEEKFEPFVTETIEKLSLTYNLDNFKTKNLRAIFLYFKAVQQRFRRHYMAEVERYTKVGPVQCYSFEKVGKDSLEILKEIAKVYRSSNVGVEKPGIRSAIMGKGTHEFYTMNRETLGKELHYNDSRFGVKPGGAIEDIEYLIQIYNLFFSIKLSLGIQDIRSTTLVPIDTTGQCHWLDIWRSGAGHAVCFLQCGGKQYYYDDNEGIFLFPWKDFLTLYNTFLSEAKSDASPQTIVFGSFAQIKDKGTGTVLFETHTFPFLSMKTSDGEIRYTILSEGETPIKIKMPLENPTFYEESFESNDKLYTFAFNSKGKDIEFELRKLLSITNLSTPTTKSTYNVNTGSLFGSRYKDMYSTLQKAIYLEDTDAIRASLNTNQADINAMDRDGNTILHVAVKVNDMDLAKRVVETSGIDMNKQNKDGDTPLTLAILKKHYAVAEYLLRKGANIAIKNKQGIYPVEMLIGENNLTNSSESFKLLEMLAPVGRFDLIADKNLYYTIKVRNFPLLALFRKYGLNLNKPMSKEQFGTEYYPLEFAVYMGDLELFTFFLEQGANPNYVPNPYTPTRKIMNRLEYWLQTMPETLKQQFMAQLEKYTPKQGGKFSHTRKNRRTKIRKARKISKRSKTRKSKL